KRPGGTGPDQDRMESAKQPNSLTGQDCRASLSLNPGRISRARSWFAAPRSCSIRRVASARNARASASFIGVRPLLLDNRRDKQGVATGSMLVIEAGTTARSAQRNLRRDAGRVAKDALRSPIPGSVSGGS